MLEKPNKQTRRAGFILLESLVSLTLITSVLIVLLSSVVHMNSFREKEKADVELYRLLYDTSLTWNKDSKQSVESYGEWSYEVDTTASKIGVSNDQYGLREKVELISIELN